MIQLFNRLNNENVLYCQWKSTYRLNESIQGLTDFDILVDPVSSIKVNTLLLELGYHQMSSHNNSTPGITDFIGYDIDSQTRVHIHLHYRLIIGGHGFKSHLLPYRDIVLNTSRMSKYGVPVISPVYELPLLLVRILLKLSLRDAVKHILGKSLLPSDLSADLEHLKCLKSLDRVSEGFNIFSPTIPDCILHNTFRELSTSHPNILHLVLLKRKMLTSIHHWAIQDKIPYYFSLLRSEIANLSLLKSKRKGKVLVNGGISIAFVGADGSGKSSLVKKTEEWLSWKLDVKVIYSGFKPKSLCSRIILKLITISGKIPINLMQKRFRFLLISLYYYSVHRHLQTERNRGYKAMASGSVVIYDRFPLVELDGIMDWRLPEMNYGRLNKYLHTKCEKMLHAAPLPDMVIFLDVDETNAIKRKSDHDRAVISQKIRNTRRALESNPNILTIETNSTLETAVLAVKKAICEFKW